MHNLIAIAAGGALGSVARYLLSTWVTAQGGGWRFPWGTLIVNTCGCLAVGILAGLIARYDLFSAQARLFLFVGVAGGFTTFSAFGLDTIGLLKRGEWLLAGTYVLASVIVGLAMVWLGFMAIQSRAG